LKRCRSRFSNHLLRPMLNQRRVSWRAVDAAALNIAATLHAAAGGF
jgi:hypothetical protein